MSIEHFFIIIKQMELLIGADFLPAGYRVQKFTKPATGTFFSLPVTGFNKI